MDINQVSNLASSAVIAAIPLMFAGAGELVAEKSGVLNLGVEGMMLMGAVTGYAVTSITGSPWLGVLASIIAGLLMALLFGFLTITMLTNQVATGLSLTIFGSAFRRMSASRTRRPRCARPSMCCRSRCSRAFLCSARRYFRWIRSAISHSSCFR